MNRIKIAVDAGHGSNTAGKRTPPMPQSIDFENDGVIDVKKGTAIREHIANVGVAMLLVSELERCEFDVIKTGFNDSNAYDDEDTALTKRQQTIKSAECEYSVSIHFNAYGDGDSFNSAEGVGIYIHSQYPKDSKLFATKVLNQLSKGTKQKNRGITPAQLALCNCNTMGTKASILVECAFMTNRYEAVHMMGSIDYWEETAVEIAKGVCDYTRVTYVGAVNDNTEENSDTYKIQLGAFRNKSNADNMVSKVKVSGFTDAFVYTTMLSGSPLYRVQVGAYSIKKNADNLLLKAKAAGYTDAFIQSY